MSERDELIGMVLPILEKCFDSDWNMTYSEMVTDALLAAGYRKPRTISTAEELDGLADGSAVLDAEGDISTKHAHWWHGYETAPLTSRKVAKYGPLTVLYEPTA